MDKFDQVGHDVRPQTSETNTGVLLDLIEYVRNPKFVESWGLVCFVHVIHKRDLYAGAYLRAAAEVDACRDRLERKAEANGVPKDERWKVMFEDSQLSSLTDIAAQFEILRNHCELKARNLESGSAVSTLLTNDKSISDRVKELRNVLDDFASKTMQADVSDYIAKLLLAFFQNPYFAQGTFFSMMLVGPAGTGKTTIANDVARVLSASGLFEGGFVEKGKPDFICQYLGQTPHITRNTLTSALEGVLFVDEAYGLCNVNDAGQVDAYGSEFATALVDFMTKFKGLNFIMVAGYEEEMTRQFLEANEGIPRRFPHRFVLKSMDEQQMASIVDGKSGSLLRPKTRSGALSEEAERLVQRFVGTVRRRGSPALRRLIANQAGSASNIAEFVSLTSEGKRKDRYFKKAKGLTSLDAIANEVERQGRPVTRKEVEDALFALLSQTEMSHKREALKELVALLESIDRNG